MRLRAALALAALTGLTACGSPAPEATTNEGDDTPIVDVVNEVEDISNEAVPDAGPEPAFDVQSFDRIGPIRIGATLRQLEGAGLAVAGQDEPLDEGSTCTYATFKGMPDIAVMLDGERIVRIDVGDGQYQTLGGVRVGHSEADALRRLGGKAKVQPHPYTGPEGHYLVVHENEAPRGLIIETDGKTVQSWRVGQWEQVQWIEGCA